MACSVCAANVERKLNSLEGITSATVSLAGRTALVDYDTEKITLEDMKREISNAGYDLVIEADRSAEEINRREFTLLKRKTLLSWFFAILVMAISMGWVSTGMENTASMGDGMMRDSHASAFNNQISLILALLNMLYCGRMFYVSAWKQLKHRTANMDSLVALSTLIAFLFSAFNTFFGEMVWGARGIEWHVYFDDHHLRSDRKMPGREGEGWHGGKHQTVDGLATEDRPTGRRRAVGGGANLHYPTW